MDNEEIIKRSGEANKQIVEIIEAVADKTLIKLDKQLFDCKLCKKKAIIKILEGNKGRYYCKEHANHYIIQHIAMVVFMGHFVTALLIASGNLHKATT